MAEKNGGTNAVAIFAIVVLVIIVAAFLIYFFNASSKNQAPIIEKPQFNIEVPGVRKGPSY